MLGLLIGGSVLIVCAGVLLVDWLWMRAYKKSRERTNTIAVREDHGIEPGSVVSIAGHSYRVVYVTQTSITIRPV